MSLRSRPVQELFWERVKKTPTCWLWTGYIENAYGYGKLHARGESDTPLAAHRISWELHFGPIPNGLSVLHRCDIRHCVCPNHLFLGTQTDNMLDCMKKGRHCRGEKHGMAKLSWEDVCEIRRAYSANEATIKKLSERFGITFGKIWAVVAWKTWRESGKTANTGPTW